MNSNFGKGHDLIFINYVCLVPTQKRQNFDFYLFDQIDSGEFAVSWTNKNAINDICHHFSNIHRTQ